MIQGEVVPDSETRRKVVEGDLNQIRTADVLMAFKGMWGNGFPHISVAVNSGARLGRNEVTTVYDESHDGPVSPPAVHLAHPFVYTDFGLPGVVRRDEYIKDLDAHAIDFANGVRLNVKTMAESAGTVDLIVHLAGGKIAHPPKDGLDEFAENAFLAGGLKRDSIKDLADSLAGHNIQLALEVLPDCVIFRGHCRKRELLFCLQLVGAYLTDAAYDADAMRQIQAELMGRRSVIRRSSVYMVTSAAEGWLTQSDSRFGLVPAETVKARTFAELSTWLEPQLKHAPLDLAVVGDVGPAEAAAAAAATLGALPARDPLSSLPPPRPVTLAKLPLVHSMHTLAAAEQGAVYWYWPAPDIAAVPDHRVADFLARVLSDRMRVRIRDELGASYTPEARYVMHPEYRGFNYFYAGGEVAPAQLSSAASLIMREVEILRSKGIAAETFSRLRPAILHEYETLYKSRNFWLESVLCDLREYPENLAVARDYLAGVNAVTVEQLNRALQKYFFRENSLVLTALPVTATPRPVARPATVGNDKLYPAAMLDNPPQLLHRERALYPLAVRQRGVRGVVIFEVVVGRDGAIQGALPLQSPAPELTASCLVALQKFRYSPPIYHGVPVLCVLQVTFKFGAAEPAAEARFN